MERETAENNAFSNLLLKKNILDLSSNQAISMAGNYFILKRYLKNNKIPKEIYLFCIPGFLHNDLNQKWTYSYFESVFTDNNENKEIQKLKPNLYNNDFDIDKYLERRKKSINLGGYKPRNRLPHVEIDEKDLKIDLNYMNQKIKKKIIRIDKEKDLMESIPMAYLNKIIKLCQENNIDFTLVIEPMPKEYNAIFKTSKWNKYLTEKKINYLNINDYYIFNTYFFKGDGTHIGGKVNQYYQNLIDKHILDIY